MWTNKYKLARNHKLLPQLARKALPSSITTYGLLNHSERQQYQLHRHPEDLNAFVLFNQAEYLQRQCSVLIINKSEVDSSQQANTIKTIAEHYPGEGGRQTLAIIVANSPEKTNELILGGGGEQSILTLAYKDLLAKKQLKSQLYLSIIGIESENILTDELDFNWLQNGQKLMHQAQALRSIMRAKSKINLVRQPHHNHYSPDHLSRHKIDSEQNLKQILEKYNAMKQYLQAQTQRQDTPSYYQMGEVYLLSQAEHDKEGRLVKVVKTQYVWRVNQYFRNTSSLMLRLGMNLKKMEENDYRLLDVQDSKIFRLLSECFAQSKDNKGKEFAYHLFLQIGEYTTFKDQHLCLAPTSHSQPSKPYSSGLALPAKQFFYSKHYLQNTTIMQVIIQIENRLGERQMQKLQSAIKGQQQALTQARLRLQTKSYHFDTVCSVERKMPRRHLLTELNQSCDAKVELEQLVHRTSKMQSLPRVNRTSFERTRQSPLANNSSSKVQLFSKMKKAIKIEKIPEYSSQQQQKKSPHPKAIQNHNIRINIQTPAVGQKIQPKPNLKYYQKVRKWLDYVYGSGNVKRKPGVGGSRDTMKRAEIVVKVRAIGDGL